MKFQEYLIEKSFLEESFELTDENSQELYKAFQKSYDDSVGHSWSYEKFVQRASGWNFYGDETGYITARKQKSGLYKITGAAGSPKGILKGLEELNSMNIPLWTAATDNITSMLKKKGFVVFKGIIYYPVVKIMIESIPSYVFGDSIESVKKDAAIVFNVDGHLHEKYFCCNKKYLLEMLKSTTIPENLKKLIKPFI